MRPGYKQTEVGVIPEDWEVDTTYTYHYLNGNIDILRNLNQGTSIAGITRETLRELYILVPPLKEQRAIAAVLSDIDNLLAALDRLIAKKRAVKTGAMQQLLTGEVRVGEGGNGRWEKKIGAM
jgi:type I restriction enzyme, S subunit